MPVGDNTDQVDVKVDINSHSATLTSDQDSEAKYAGADYEQNVENQVGREKSLPPDFDSPANEDANEDRTMSTIVAFEDLGKNCDKAQLEELIMLVQAKIEAARKEKEK